MIPNPMLAVAADLDQLVFPLLASPKIDGLRCLVKDGVAFSRKKEPFRNKYLQRCIMENKELYEGIDGEIIVGGDPTAEDVFRKSTSGCMSEDNEPDFHILAFDRYDLPHLGYQNRLKEVPEEIRMPTVLIKSIEQLISLEEKLVAKGFEGIMVRSLDGPYKQGRSTVREGYLLKIKRFLDAEATIIGFTERMHNANEKTKDNLGHSKRSSHKENMVPLGTLGAIVLEMPDGQTFKVGTGMDDALRQELWDTKETLLGKQCKYKYTSVGMKDLPRFPVFLGIRHADDLS